MSVYGIICEFNPIHLGHQYLIETARRRGASAVVCLMSGNTTQRGEWAVTDPYVRAEAAVRAGADLVLELPFPWCSASAEGFANGGISVLRHFADTLLFGSECGDLARLRQAADAAAAPTFRQAYQAALVDGRGAAEAYLQLLNEVGVAPLASNDLLGVAYLCAVRQLHADLHLQILQRQGAAYRETAVSAHAFPSAMAIRTLWEEGRFAEAEAFLPPDCAAVFRRAWEEGNILSAAAQDALWLSFFRMHRGEELADCKGAEGGLAHRLCAAARQATSAKELFEAARTKRYTDAHIRRTMLYCLAHVTDQDLHTLPVYTTLLAANATGRAILAQQRKQDGFPVITKPADAPRDTAQYRWSEIIGGMASLTTHTKHAASYLLQRSPYIQID